MITDNLPLLTRGPFAIFYGGEAIIPLLSSEPAGNHFAIADLTSIAFLIFMVFYKKLKMRKLPTQQRLKELVVSNFLNVFTILLILISLGLVTLGVLYHLYTIKKYSAVSEEGIKLSSNAYWKNILIITMIETIIQSYSFLTNQALR